MSLYLKYRPRTLDDLVGQNHIKTTIQNAIQMNKVSHGYIFSGPRGTGKTSTARLIARAVVCKDDETLIKAADEGNLVDIIEIDAASNRGIDEIRDLRDKIQFAPVIGKAKVYIIDEVHMLTKEAFNALLKTLEEPPSHAYFILATTEIHKVPETILSRCQQFSFQRISPIDIAARLKYICEQEKFSCEEEALDIIADNANGGLRDAISSLEQMAGSGTISLDNVQENLGLASSKVIEAFASELIAGKAHETLEAVQKLVYEGYDLSQFLRELIEHLRDRMIESVNKKESPERIVEVITVLQEAYQKVKLSPIPQLPLEVACVKLGQDLKDVEIEEKSGGLLTAIGLGTKKEEKTETVPKKETTKQVISEEKKTEEKSIETTELLFSLESVQNNWNHITDKILSPTVKAAARNAKAVSAENGVLEIAVGTDFYLDTLSNAKGNGEVSLALEAIFHQKIKVKVKKEDKIQLTPKTEEVVENEVKEEEKKNESSIVDMANEIFGA